MANENQDTRTIAFKAPPELKSAMQAVADRDLCTVSYVIRRAVLRDLRERGFLFEMESA
jgi:predicted transcriptional regulator